MQLVHCVQVQLLKTPQIHCKHPIYNGLKCFVFLAPFCILGPILYCPSVLYSWLCSIFLAAFRGLHCEIDQFLAPALRPTSRQNIGIMKTATFGAGAEKKG